MKKTVLSLLLAVCLLLSCVPLAFADGPTFSDPASAAAYLKEHMLAREPEIGFSFKAAKSAVGELNRANLSAYFSEAWDAIEANVFAHTGVGNEGDYLKYNMSEHGYQYGVTYSSMDTEVTYNVTATADYYATAAQEKQVTEAAAKALAGLNLTGKSDYEKVRAITDYICEHTEYDYVHLNDDSYDLKQSAYAALINGTSVCQGYATLFYRMALEAGLDCRVISGDADNGKATEAHAWNIVRVDGVYYNIDPTWIDGTQSDEYFLKGNNHWTDHFPEEDPLSDYPVSDYDYVAAAGNPSDTWQGFAAAAFSGGSGTKADPYLIASPEELALLAKLVNEGSGKYASACYRQYADLDLSDHDWTPIGYTGQPAFTGVYDGDNYSVSHMSVVSPFALHAGLFGVLGGTVKNLNLTDSSVAITDEEARSLPLHAGLLCGTLQGSEDGLKKAVVSNCRILDSDVTLKTACSALCGAVCGFASSASVDTVLVKADLSADTGAQSVCAGGAIGAVSSFCDVSNLYAETNMKIRNDSSRCQKEYHMLHCAGGLFGFLGYDPSNVMLEETHVGMITWLYEVRDIAVADCNAVGTINSVHTGDADSSCGQLAGFQGPVYGEISFTDCVGEVYLTLSGGNETDDTNNTGTANHSIYNQFADYADHAVFRNLIAKDFNCPGFSAFVPSIGEDRDFSSVDGFMWSVFSVRDDSSEYDGCGDIVRTGDNTYACYTPEDGVFEVATDRFMEDVLHLSPTCWKQTAPDSVRLAVSQTACVTHVWDAGRITTPATCTENGVKTFTCTVCKMKKTEPVMATGHQPVTDKAVAATCTKDGKTEGSHCSVCGEVLTAQKTVKATGHQWDNGKITTAPTCVKDGVKTFTCTVCGQQKTEKAAATGEHAFSEWTVTKEATADEEGEESRLCAVCLTKETRIIPKLTPGDPGKPDFTPGDVDGDGRITSADARLALRRSVSLEDYPEDSAAYLACDVDHDGKVTSADARLILRASVGLEDVSKWKK